VHTMRGNVSGAHGIVQALVRSLPNSATIQTELGLLELRRKNLGAARSAFEKALTIEPDFLDALNALTRIDLQKSKPAARARIDAAVERNPQNTRILVLAASTYAVLRDFPRAELLLKRAIEADPSNLRAYGALAQVYEAQQRLDEAIAEYQRAAKRQPQSVAIQTTIGMLLERQNKTNEAKTVYEQVLDKDPQNAAAANNLAWIYAAQGGNLDIALQLAQTAKAKLPDMPEVNDTLGWIYQKKGLHSLAVVPLKSSVERDPGNPSYHYHLGVAYLGTGDKGAARTSLERALALNPKFPEAGDARAALARASTN
jgi:tetratricopeptide (TPR) repeat protein